MNEQNKTNEIQNEIQNEIHNPQNPQNPQNGLTKMNHEDYMSGIQQAVERYKLTHPEQYERNARLGQYIMNQRFDVESGIDVKGHLIKCKTILYTISEYDLNMQDLYDNEVQILNCILVDYLNCIKSLEWLFENRDYIETCMVQVLNKLEELVNVH